jgi:hypothetical protein
MHYWFVSQTRPLCCLRGLSVFYSSYRIGDRILVHGDEERHKFFPIHSLLISLIFFYSTLAISKGHGAHAHHCTGVPLVPLQNFLIFPKRSLVPMSSRHSLSPALHPQPASCLSGFAGCGRFYRGSHSICSLVGQSLMGREERLL